MRMLVLAGLAVVAIWLPAARDGASIANDYPFVERVTVSSEGEEANGFSSVPALSADGRYVAFDSSATNLVPNDTNGSPDVFVRDRLSGITSRTSVSSNGREGDRGSYTPSISSDGRFVAFMSLATTFSPGIDGGHIYVHDRETGMTELIASGDWPAISGDGRYVSYYTHDTEAFHVYDRESRITVLASVDVDGAPLQAADFRTSISGNGRFTLVRLDPGDGSPYGMYIYDRESGATERIDVTSTGEPANGTAWMGSISSDGSFATFWSEAWDLVPGQTSDLFLADLSVEDSSTLVSIVPGARVNPPLQSVPPIVSRGGRFVAFISSDLLLGETNWSYDAYIHDVSSGSTRMVSLTEDRHEIPTGLTSFWGTMAMSDDARFIAVESEDGSIVADDTNGVQDIFVYDVSKLDEVAATAPPVLTPTPTSPPPVESTAPTPGVLPPTGGRLDRDLRSSPMVVGTFLLVLAGLAGVVRRRLSRSDR